MVSHISRQRTATCRNVPQRAATYCNTCNTCNVLQHLQHLQHLAGTRHADIVHLHASCVFWHQICKIFQSATEMPEKLLIHWHSIHPEPIGQGISESRKGLKPQHTVDSSGTYIAVVVHAQKVPEPTRESGVETEPKRNMFSGISWTPVNEEMAGN